MKWHVTRSTAALAVVVAWASGALPQTTDEVTARVSVAQSVDDIVTRNLVAKGGVDKLKSIQSLRQTSRMTMQGMEAGMVILSKRPNMLRQEITLGSQKVINGFDGQAAWIVNPLVSPGGQPIRLTGPEAEVIRQQSDFDPPLMDYKAKGYSIELVGTETDNGKKVYHLRLTQPNRTTTKPQVQHAYLDAATGLETKLVTEADGLRLEQEMLDWRSIEGVMVPFHIRMLSNGVVQSEIRVEKVEFNVTIDDSVFMIPK